MPSPKYLHYSELRVNSLNSLPTELLLAIINEFYPDINNYVPLHRRRIQLAFPEKYFAQVRFLASQRLLSSFWNHLITPILFSTFVSEPQRTLARDAEIFKNHGPLIRRLILRGHISKEPFTEQEVLGACLAQCTNVQTLDFIAISDVLLRSRKGDVEKMFASLKALPALKSVIFRSPGGSYQRMAYGVSHALVGIGRAVENVTELRVSHWANSQGKQYQYKLQLPSALPNLEHLRLDSLGSRTHADVEKLVSRVVRKERGVDGVVRKVVPLRRLEIDDWSGEFVDRASLRKILAMNKLGEGLTTLYFHCGRGLISNIQELESLPLFIVSACPNLVQLHFTPPCNANILRKLPSKLRELGLKIPTPEPRAKPILPPSIITSHEPLVNFLSSPDGRSLAGLTLLISRVLPDEDGDMILEEACSRAGVNFKS